MIIEVYKLDNPLVSEEWYCKEITIVEEVDIESISGIYGDHVFYRILMDSIKPEAGDHIILVDKIQKFCQARSTIKLDEALYRWGHREEFYK